MCSFIDPRVNSGAKRVNRRPAISPRVARWTREPGALPRVPSNERRATCDRIRGRRRDRRKRFAACWNGEVRGWLLRSTPAIGGSWHGWQRQWHQRRDDPQSDAGGHRAKSRHRSNTGADLMALQQRQRLPRPRDDQLYDPPGLGSLFHIGAQPAIQRHGRGVREDLQARLRLRP
jgi:hypothetical protein